MHFKKIPDRHCSTKACTAGIMTHEMMIFFLFFADISYLTDELARRIRSFTTLCYLFKLFINVNYDEHNAHFMHAISFFVSEAGTHVYLLMKMEKGRSLFLICACRMRTHVMFWPRWHHKIFFALVMLKH